MADVTICEYGCSSLMGCEFACHRDYTSDRFGEMMAEGCQWKDCRKAAVHCHDHSIQLPDYRGYCDEHYPLVQAQAKKQSHERMIAYLKSKIPHMEAEMDKVRQEIAKEQSELDAMGPQ